MKNENAGYRQRRRAWSTAEERRQTLSRFRQSGVSQQRFAQQEGLSFATLRNWLQQEKETVPPSSPRMVEIPIRQLTTAPTHETASIAEIQLPGGAQVRFRGALATEFLNKLTEVLR